MSSSMIVPVIDVQGNNFKELWAAMVLAIKTSSFIALDTELSGLGSRKALLAESIEDRYKAICHAARTRSILSLGFACYKELDNKADSTYLVQIYNLTLLCSEEYVIEPQSVKFLVQHGFDFNKQYAEGISYFKGNDRGGDRNGINMRTLFVELLQANKPLVVHNGLIDMVFLYQCFYAHLPERLGTFTADLSQMFPSGIYDTKYATEYELRFTASYLEYAYKKCKLQNSRDIEGGGNGSRVFLEFCKYTGNMESYIDYRPCSDNQNQDGALNICVQYSAYGWCPNGSQCTMSHDTDLIIQQDEKIKDDKRKKRKRKNKKKDSKVASESCSSPQGKRSHIEGAELDQAVPMSEPAVPMSEPAVPMSEPAVPMSEPAVPMSEPAVPMSEPAVPMSEPAVPMSEPALPMPEPALPMSEPALPMSEPALPMSEPALPMSEPALPEHQEETARAEPADDMDVFEPGETASKNGNEESQPEVPAEAPSEAPSEAHAEAPAEAPSEAPSEAHAEAPAEAPDRPTVKKVEGGTHRAGFDAFMTGYIFAYARNMTKTAEESSTAPLVPTCLNKLFLSGKSVPLHVVKSTFSKSSKAHMLKMDYVWGKSTAVKAEGNA